MRDVRGCSDRRQVAAEGRAAEQTVVHDFRVDAEVDGNDRDDGEHGCGVGDVVDECRENDGHPDYDSIDDEHAAGASADFRYGVADDINNARVLYTADYDKKTGQKNDGVVVDLFECVLTISVFLWNSSRIMPTKKKNMQIRPLVISGL